MKRKLVLAILFCCANALRAQLVITPGAQLSLADNTQLVLENMDLVNNGSLLTGYSNIFFTGNTPSSVSGSQPLQFYSIDISKGLLSSLLLQKNISVQQTIHFSAGFLNLNGYDIDLGSSGQLSGEKESSRVTGDNGGRLLSSSVLNAPAGVNPGGLGAVISSSQNLGSTIVRRGHASQVNAYNTGSSIRRYYEIIPANNTGLNATLRFYYLTQELNGFDENNLYFWKTSGPSWQNIGITARSTTQHYAEKTGLSGFSRITLSSATNALPVRFELFNASCSPGGTSIKWTTGQEQNTHAFIVERSTDGLNFIPVGQVPAAGNSSSGQSYHYTDNSTIPVPAYYRIAETDRDGKKTYSGINRLQCGGVRENADTWPNPVMQSVFVNITTASHSTAAVRLFNSQGALVYSGQFALLPGSNQLQIAMNHFAAGIYHLEAQWKDGKQRQTVQLLKQ